MGWSCNGMQCGGLVIGGVLMGWSCNGMQCGGVIYFCGGGVGNVIQCGGGLGNVLQCGGGLVGLQSGVLEDLAVESDQEAGPATCCSVVVGMWGATVGLGLSGVELSTSSGLVVDLGCGAVMGTLGEASTGYNECSGHNGNLAGCGATGCCSQRALCGTSRNWDLGRLWSLFGAPGEGSTGYNECTDHRGF